MNTVLFDLDGTLLPMDNALFVKLYFGALAEFGKASFGIAPQKLGGSVWEGTMAMLKNDGVVTNRERFWATFCALVGDDVSMEEHESVFEEFYRTDFEAARGATELNAAARMSIDVLREKGYTLALATNPVFPPVAVERRLSWAGLSYADFAHVTTYDNASFCKPNPNYFKNILALLGKRSEECLMVGNDVYDDLGALEAGLDVYLVTDCLINEKNLPIGGLKQGSLADFYEYVKGLPQAE
jgi:HAD superfamily hydrolase (TIGR01549 family)